MSKDWRRWQQQGYDLVPALLDETRCAELAQCCDEIDGAGSRDWLELDACRALAAQLRRLPALTPLLDPGHVAVQCTLFRKSAARNWLVALHQDLSIPVAARVDGDIASGWSVKNGVNYCQPPTGLLAQLVAVRVHLDDCGADDGALQVVPGSHRHGRLSPQAAAELRERHGLQPCLARRGDALLLRPLLLHASSKARADSRRRVLHFLFGPRELPGGLRWHRAV
ncbi:MAG TPA: phytanoyl-CoA dioxygenase family protein [Tahibacter sp.]|nr:phytanoyl-CoA dioxygenase family protein [Tahibacter sp.]